MKCIIYSRVSTADQTTENQILQLREYAAGQGWEVFAVKTDICSGSKAADERSGLREVFDLARRRRFDVLLFWSLDRLSREGTRKTLEYLSRLDSYKVKWHSYSEEYISSLGIFADAVIALMSCLAKQERLRISDRTKAGLQRAVSQGKHWDDRSSILPSGNRQSSSESRAVPIPESPVNSTSRRHTPINSAEKPSEHRKNRP